jgi:hypothetical protein
MSVLTPEEAIKKARVLGTVEGKIKRFILDKNDKIWGFELAETIKAQTGASWDRNWTVWTEKLPDGIAEQDHVIVTGDISFKYEEYNAASDGSLRASVKGSINNPHTKPAFTKPETEEMPF